MIFAHSRVHGDHVAGDSLFRGKACVALIGRDTAAFVQSVQRLVRFTETHPVRSLLGTHIENSDVPGVDYPRGTIDQPREHALALSVANLRTLDSALTSMRGRVVRAVLPDFTIWP